MAVKARTNLTGSELNESAFKAPMHVPEWMQGTTIYGTLASFMFRDFMRSPIFWVDIVGVVLAHLLFFGNAPDRPAFFAISYFSTLLLAILTTAGIFSRANHPHSYPILARRVTKPGYVAAAMLVAWLISLLAYVLAALLVYLRYVVLIGQGSVAPEWLTPGVLIMGILPVGIGAACVVGVMALIANFVSPFGVRLLVLGIIALGVMAFDPRSFPIENLRSFVAVMPPLLAPIVGAIRFASDVQPDAVARASLIVVAAYTTTICGLVWWLSSRREIVIE